MKTKHSNLIIIIFLATIFLFLPSTSLLRKDLLLENIKKNINSTNFINPKQAIDFIKKQERYILQIFPGNSYLRLIDCVPYLISKKIKSRSVKEGKNHWLFYCNQQDGDLFSDYQALNYPSQQDLANILSNTQKNIKTIRELNALPILLICPNKGQIYPEYLPEEISLSPVSTTNFIVNFLKKNLDIPIIYPEDVLKQYSKQYELYYPTDTHWNSIGAYIANNSIINNSLNLDESLNIDKLEIKEEELAGDLTKMISIQNYYPKSKDYKIKRIGELRPIEKNSISYYHNPKARTLKTVLLIGDSYRTALLPHLSYYFTNVVGLHRKDLNNLDISLVKPDYVILEFVGRQATKLKEVVIGNISM